MPALSVASKNAEHYTAKNYFSGGDLNILYYAQYSDVSGGIIVQTALNMDSDTAESIISDIPYILIAVSFPLLLISYIAAFFISERTMKIVRSMTEAVKKISVSNLGEILPVTDTKDDFDILAKTFNDLLFRLQADFERERQFTADVSHELKTPLAVMLGHANLLRRWGKNNPEQLEKSVSALFERLIEDTKIYAPDVTTVYADRELLCQACTAIISNSVRFAGKSSHIELSAVQSAKPDFCEISIADNGPGIAPESLPHIFDRFFRADEAHTRETGGAGLGLSIVKSIADALGGSVRTQNSAESGAIIVLSIPTVKPHNTDPRIF